VSSPSLDAERKKLSGRGFKAAYWVKNASPDRSSEDWLSANGTNDLRKEPVEFKKGTSSATITVKITRWRLLAGASQPQHHRRHRKRPVRHSTGHSGGIRQLQYKLMRGEAGWILKIDRMVEY